MAIQYLLIFSLASAFTLTWRRVSQGALSRAAGIYWSLLWIAGGLVVVRPEYASVVAHWLGVGRGVDVVTYLAIAGVYYLVFRLFLKLDQLDRDITVLVRHVGLVQAGRERGETGTDAKR